MSCQNHSATSDPQSFRWRFLASPAYWLANRLFHSFLARSSESMHHRVMRIFRFAADRDHVMACSVYGHLLYYRGSAFIDKQQGFEYLLKAARYGEIKACYQCAVDILDGKQPGSEQDAILWLNKAAQADHPLAINKLAEMPVKS